MVASVVPSRITSPLLTGMRPEAQKLLATLPANLSGHSVVLDGHRTLAATPSFADEMIRVLLVERNADHVHAIAVGSEFGEWLRESAQDHNVSGKLKVED